MAQNNTTGNGNWSAAVLIDGSFLGIPMSAQLTKLKDAAALTGSFTLKEEQVLTLLEHLSLSWKEQFTASPLYPLVQGMDCRGVLLADTKGRVEAIGESGDFAIGLVRADGKLLILATIAREQLEVLRAAAAEGIVAGGAETGVAECAVAGAESSVAEHAVDGAESSVAERAVDGTDTAVFADFLEELQSALGVEQFCAGFKEGRSGFGELCGMLARLEAGAFETSRFARVILPDQAGFQDVQVLVSGTVDLSKSNYFFFRTLARLMPDGLGMPDSGIAASCMSASRMSFAAGYGSPSFVLVQAGGMVCTFLLGKNPEIRVTGRISFTIGNKPVTFQVDCRGKSNAFGISAEFESAAAPIPVWGRFSLSQLGIAVGIENGDFYFGGYGILQMGRLDLFALVFARQTAGVLRIPALGLALNRMTLASLMESVLSVELPGLRDLDFLSLEPLPLQAQRMDSGVFGDTSEEGLHKIAENFNSVSRGDCGGRSASPVSGDRLVVRPCEGGWIMTDKTNIRHYQIRLDGEIALVPQMYYCSMDNLPAGSYVLYRGLFVCASLVFLGMKVNFYGEMDEKSGFEALVTLTPVSYGLLEIGRARKMGGRLLSRCPVTASGSVMEQYLYDGEGPVFYLCVRKGYFRLYLDASVRLLGILEADAYITCDTGRFYLYTEIQFFLMRAKLMLSADFQDFTKGNFAFALVIDLSLFQDVMNQVARSVRAFVAEAQSRITDVQAKLTYAQDKVMGLTNQINDLNWRIDGYRRELSGLRWYQFFRAGYLLIVIGGLEIAKAGIYLALGAALAALEIAKLALEAVKQVTGAVGYLVQKLAEGIASIFFLKEIGFSLDLLMDQGMNASMYTRFNLFGKEYQLDGRLSLKGDVKNALHRKVSGDVANKTNEELGKMKAAEAAYRAELDGSRLVTGLKAFLEANEFPYDDCDGYRICLSDALDYGERYAYLYGCMEAAYYCDFGAEDDMAESHRGQMAEKLREGKVFWTSCLGGMAELDCQKLVDEVRKETMVNGFGSGDGAGALEEMERSWEKLRGFQQDVRERMPEIEQMDDRFWNKAGYHRDRILASGIGSAQWPGADAEGTEDRIERYMGEVYSICTDEILHDTVAETGRGITDAGERFSLNDRETFFLNPANEPVMDRLFVELCEHTGAEQMKELEQIARENRKKKAGFKNYRIRIPE